MITFEYPVTEYLAIASIEITGLPPNAAATPYKLAKSGDKWQGSFDIPPGEYRYRFLINQSISLNDPMANYYMPDEKEQLWSVLKVNDSGQRLFNAVEYTVNISGYNITDNMYQQAQAQNKKSFVHQKDERVVTRFEFDNVTGLHTVTTVWFTPLGEVFQVLEENLFKPEEGYYDPLILWFWLSLNENKAYPSGSWRVKLFIDGMYILEDEFKLTRTDNERFPTSSFLDIKG